MKTILAGIMFFMLLWTTPSHAQHRWQMAIGAPDTNYLGQTVKDFLDQVRVLTNGDLDIQLHPRGSLIQQPHIMRGVRTNQIQLGKTLLALHGNEDAFFEMEGIPFLANTWQETRTLQSVMEPHIRERLNQRGVTLLFSIPWTSQGLYTQRPIQQVQDLRGQRLRIYNPVTSRMATLLGATPVNIVASEMPQAFAAGMITAMFTSAQTGVDFAAWDYVRVYTEVGAMRNRAVVIMNSRVLESAPAHHRAAILQAARHAEQLGFERAMQIEQTSVQQLQQRGVQIHMPTPQLMQQLNQVGQQLIDEWITRTGESGRAVIQEYMRATGR